MGSLTSCPALSQKGGESSEVDLLHTIISISSLTNMLISLRA
nr:MAG TPA: hypothetical protein [Caudoviricetes sp.]